MFAVNMGTGILSIVIAAVPFTFRGQQSIANIIYVLNIVLYCLFLLITVLRHIMFPSILNLLLKHASQSLFLANIPMGLATITNFTVSHMIDVYPRALDLSFALWVVGLVMTVFSILCIPYFVIVHHSHQLESMYATWLLPIVPAVVTAASGGTLANHLDADRGVVVLLISYILMGAGLLLSLSIVAIYYYRLVLHKLPPKELIITGFLPLGPFSQGAYGLIQLGSAAHTIFSVKPTLVPNLGEMAYGMGVMAALLLWGYGLWYLCIAIFSVGVTAKYRIPFNMGWWGMTFPFGAFTSATLSIGALLDSIVFNVLGTILVCILTIMWISVMSLTLHGAYTGKMFYAPCLTPVVLNP